MADVKLNHIYKVYDNPIKKKGEAPRPAVSDFCMDIEDKEFIVFVGPSGCGKSTTLRMVAGLEEISAGELYIDGKLVNEVEPKDRDIAMVFQNYALYPHMTVYDNIAFALKLRKFPQEETRTLKDGTTQTRTVYKHMPKAQIRERVLKAAAILDIEQYLDRKPKALSGGQRQRVALGRAIVRNPKVFLLDEPLSNLDAKLRATMRTEITKLHKKLQTTFIYVTHDQVEAMTMGSRIVVMKDGFVQQIGSPQYLYEHPVNKFVAGFIGTPQMSFFQGTLSGSAITLSGGQVLSLPQSVVAGLVSTDEQSVWVGVRSEDIAIATEGTQGAFPCRITAVEELGSETIMYATLDIAENDDVVVESTGQLVAKLPARTRINADEVVYVTFKMENIHIFHAATEQTLFADGQKDIITHQASMDGQTSVDEETGSVPEANEDIATE